MTATVFDETRCLLGEGPLWHPERGALFWFDILNRRLYGEGRVHQFDEYVSAAGWVDTDTLLVASQTQLFTFNLETGEDTFVAPLEADNLVTRSNDGRADPAGGFWIGTMGINAERKAGSIYRYYKGTVERLFDRITISNAISFAPDGTTAYFTDTATRHVMRVALDDEGWPASDPVLHLDLRGEDLNPDGAVVDADGCLWIAQWGAGRVARYDADGAFLGAVSVGGQQASCPAFGGPDLKTLFVTTAADGLDGAGDGKTYHCAVNVTGQREHRVIL
ncbi:SMP-30/gluconolactonase/LRE family protein [Sulfitobacter sp. S190]|uniref:SMP-30/gluconolactonase/LRE family protein n=1 Tax=Sulfitobacter sp. S190 TaxID=2867022 RepID=UPI0021A496F3|nr:SMP-30/gluconolactonase/LRE family protein [Sulfitobacter sp. S190]UWR24464.1 SMP-30/gluconolactonase/LRE family protein [Sulfitobacter sp. S190]UWR24486.1 SMP-30/gluconolactonase/LRE family protein [Sulfitobacter sp. S190]